ncbi:MAG: carboxypeptidase-like regulatory domain-containing protein, partial [Thermoplasmatota archaeon]
QLCLEKGDVLGIGILAHGFHDLLALVVVDAAIVPVAEAIVTVDGTDLEQITDAQGAFGFDGLEPGAYFISVTKPGYESAQTQAIVEANDPAPPVLKVRLLADPTTTPFVESFAFKGLLGCSITTPTISAAACGVGPVAEATGNDFLKEHTFNLVPEHVQSELTWKKTQATGDRLSVSWTDLNGDGQVQVSAEEGTSPVITSFQRDTFEALNLTGVPLSLRVFSTSAEGTDVVDDTIYQDLYRDNLAGPLNDTGVRDTVGDVTPQCVSWICVLNPIGEDCIRDAALFDSCFSWGGAGAAIDQSFDIYTNIFVNFAPQEGWTFVNDGAHPAP